MQLGTLLPLGDIGGDPATVREYAQAAEAIGYHATGLLKRRLIETPTRRFGFLLQKREDVFYSSFGQELARATTNSKDVNGKALVDFSEELVPRTIAARLEAHTKQAGREILIDEDTQRMLRDGLCTEALGAVPFKGKSAVVEIFAVGR